MQKNPTINLRDIADEQVVVSDACGNRKDEPTDEQQTAWIEEYAASGAVKDDR